MTDAAVIERSDRPRPDAATVAEATRVALADRARARPCSGPAGGWPRVSVESWVTLVVVAACAGFVFDAVHPDLIFRNTTPTGGDMGAHVWGPRYLREHLLPARAAVGLDARLVRRLPRLPVLHGGPVALRGAARARPVERARGRAAGPRCCSALACRAGSCRRCTGGRVAIAGRRGRRHGRSSLPIPYNVAFKLVTVSGPGGAADRGVGLRPAGRRCRSRARRSSPSRRCSSSTTASRCSTAAPATSSAATWRRRWRASSPSRSA